MAHLQIRVRDLHFSASWEPAAPRSVQTIRGLLPLKSQFVHVRWSGEAVWVPFGDWRPELGWENHTSHPAPGQILIYPGGISECEVILAYGACDFSSKLGQLAGNHFASIDPDEGWRERLRELGRRCLWEGAQPLEIVETG